jgi:hypothetical protein
MNPSDFTDFPHDSEFAHYESEVVARNIMVILSRTGNTWRELSYKEYQQRLADGGYTEHEMCHFEQVIRFTVSEEAARRFSPAWRNK